MLTQGWASARPTRRWFLRGLGGLGPRCSGIDRTSHETKAAYSLKQKVVLRYTYSHACVVGGGAVPPEEG